MAFDMKSQGTSDIPLQQNGQDQFRINNYVDSLSDFILTCDTPMTIAIQGDWGTGKTSMMNLIQGRINKSVKTVFFNTWHYSQFNLGDQLPILLFNKLIKSLSDTNTEVTEKFKSILKGMAGIVVGNLSGGTADGSIFDVDIDLIEQLEKLRETFQTIISHEANKYPKKRVVIFIDDLDRLQPEKAVELLEVMKVFLDCKDCVFVLAIDYSVVSQGIRAKFGESVSNEKGRSFFDKIIQLPFKMPVGQYSIDKYLISLMHDIWGDISLEDEVDIDKYIEVIDNTIGKNPRSIKRAVNSFIIINKVAEKEGTLTKKDTKRQAKQKLLFALLCIQLSSEPLYNYLLSQIDYMSEHGDELINNLRDDEQLKKVLTQIFHLKSSFDESSDFFKRMDSIIEIFCDWCEELAENNKDLSYKYCDVVSIMSFSSITSNDTVDKPNRTEKRYGTLQDLIKTLKPKQSVIDLYKEFESYVFQQFGSKVFVQATLGQRSMVFKYKDKNNINRNMIEVKIQKTALTFYIYRLQEVNISDKDLDVLAPNTDIKKRRIREKDIKYNSINDKFEIEDMKRLVDIAHRYVMVKYGS